MLTRLLSFVGPGHEAAYRARETLALELAAAAPESLRAETCCLTLLAGAGTRWVKSLALAKERAAAAEPFNGGSEARNLVERFPLSAPRGLFPVRNFIASDTPMIPMGAYAVDAFKGLGRQLLVVRGWEEEIRASILQALQIDDRLVTFFTQREGPSGKVLGHGDAARQAKEAWRDSRYILANFGGDANSPLTALASLLALAELDAAGEKVGLLLPVARIANPVYPVILDDAGLPRAFGHNKLGGTERKGVYAPPPGLSSYTNVGIRAYKTDVFLAAIEEIETAYWRDGEGYSIPGNDPEAHEFALDNIDALLAKRGEARILAVANPGELTPAKTYDEIGNFEAAAKKVREEWSEFRPTLERLPAWGQRAGARF